MKWINILLTDETHKDIKKLSAEYQIPICYLVQKIIYKFLLNGGEL